ncbi:hypothetical protein PMAC_003011, partial [Pneumocystis sp. 'macacae']
MSGRNSCAKKVIEKGRKRSKGVKVHSKGWGEKGEKGKEELIETGEAVCVESVLRAKRMGLRQLLRREEGRRRRQREKGRQEYRGERATRDIRLKRRGRWGRRAQKMRVGPGVEGDAAKYSKERANRDVRLSLTRGTERKKQRTQRGQRRGNCLKGGVEGDAAKYSREHAKQKLRLRRRGRWGRRAQDTRVGLGCGNCLEVRAGVGAGKGEEVRGTPEGVRGAGNINWRERGGGRRLTLDSQRIKRKRADPDALSAAVLAGCHVTERHQDNHHPGDRLTRDHVGLPGAWVDTRRFHSDRCRDDRDGRRKRKGGVHKGGESAAQRGAVVQSEMLGGTRWKPVGWGRVRLIGDNPSGRVECTGGGEAARMRKPIRGVMVMVMGGGKGGESAVWNVGGSSVGNGLGGAGGRVVGDDPPEVTQCGVVREAVQRKVLGVSRSRDLLLLWVRLAGEQRALLGRRHRGGRYRVRFHRRGKEGSGKEQQGRKEGGERVVSIATVLERPIELELEDKGWERVFKEGSCKA